VLSLLMIFKLRLNYLRVIALLIILLVLLQCTLGVFNVLYLLPITVAVAHNGVAALLLATVFSALHFTRKGLNDVG
jgi:heme a synthase